ncbi:zinc-ribbon domain-containing protein [Cellulomonas soli]|uniref:Zinc-ribbon 15 domain-containing protein n=1 Tax=Cellulomonas soli TaxID=931535 RepID=A0A512P8G9_9CELL|nr:zinc ribbon domain-containing protein [Cellulomonas soli]NYI57718.1 hypothetical protein [Cellulomonas soli]GEP67499.1 hypothetical protein CSO01_02140 [Cellulomonas soli]
MFIIWGWRAVMEVLGLGLFHCPTCQQDREYRHVRPRRWFTLFFVPVIPLQRLEPFVECTTCKGTYREAVLEIPTTEQLEHQLGLATRAALAHVVASAGSTPRATEEAIRRIGAAPGVGTYDEARLLVDIAAFTDRATAQRYVATAARHLSPAGREDFARRLLGLAEAWGPDGAPVTDPPIDALAAALELSPAHLAGIRQHASTGSTGSTDGAA